MFVVLREILEDIVMMVGNVFLIIKFWFEW